MKNELLKVATELARVEKKVKEFKRRIRIKGKLLKRSFNKKGNLKLLIGNEEGSINFVVMRGHKERFSFGMGLNIGDRVYAQGVSRFRAVICTQLRKPKNKVLINQSKITDFEDK